MKLQIDKIVYGGSGVGSPIGEAGVAKTVLVPFTLAGEIVEAQASAAMGSGREADLVQVLEPSKDRVQPGCIHFGQCGGCQLQHADYPTQLQTKAEILRDALKDAGFVSLPELQTHSGEPYGYRNRIRLRVSANGEPRVGYNRRGTHEFLPIQECPIATPLLWNATSHLLRLGEVEAVVARWLKAAVEVEFFCNADESRLQMNLFVREALPGGFDKLCLALQAAVPELMGAGVSLLAKEAAGRSRRIERPATGPTWGAAGLAYGVAGTDYWVSRGGFFQVNRSLIEEMVRIVAGSRKGRLAWDLYAGVGLFSRALKREFTQVLAVEGSEGAAADLGRAFKGKGELAICAPTVDFLHNAVIQRERPDLVVLDPPRAGLGTEVCTLLARLKAAEMVYVSCDPMTFARDVVQLVDSGYRLVELHMIDMFPQTFHQESVAVLQR
jgi:23S rRNA (uracil1939-C5)-methyltransferase